MFFGLIKKSKKAVPGLSDTFSENFENNSQLVKKSLFVTKKIIPPVSKLLDYGVIVILTFFASKYYMNNLN